MGIVLKLAMDFPIHNLKFKKSCVTFGITLKGAIMKRLLTRPHLLQKNKLDFQKVNWAKLFIK